MFVLRSFFWLSTVVMLLPASPDGKEPPPRVSLIHTAYAARALVQDMSGVCERNPGRLHRRAAKRCAARARSSRPAPASSPPAFPRASGNDHAEPKADHGTLTAAGPGAGLVTCGSQACR